MPRLVHIGLLVTAFAWNGSGIAIAWAQSEDVSLGEVARNLKKNQNPPRNVIDNDNLPAVMEQGENKRWSNGIHSSSGDMALKIVNASSPDVTCALSFNGQRDLVDETLRPQNVPLPELEKLEGPATIVGDSLQISIHNGSKWDLREITVGLTVIERPYDSLSQFEGVRLVPAAMNGKAPAEKRPDVTTLYHLKGSAAPSSTTLFQAPLSSSVNPDQEWHWAIVQAKGVPPVPPPASPALEVPTIQAPD